jgi:hypothetical protein
MEQTYSLRPIAGPITKLGGPITLDPSSRLYVSRFPRIADAPSDCLLSDYDSSPCIFIRDKFLSHPHAIIDFRNGVPRARVASESVKNPLWVNQPSTTPETGVREVMLAPGDRMQIGESVLRLETQSRWEAIFGVAYPDMRYVSLLNEDETTTHSTHRCVARDGRSVEVELQALPAGRHETEARIDNLRARMESLRAAQKAHEELRHVTPRIWDVRDVIVEDYTYVMLARQAIDMRSLHDQVIVPGRPWDAARALRLGLSLCDALHAFHKWGLHRNLNPHTVYAAHGDTPDDDRVKLGGLLLANPERGGATIAQRAHGTIESYRPPELLQHGSYTERSDLYVVGLLVMTALLADPPFDAPRLPDIVKRILYGEARFPDGLSSRLRGTLQQAIAVNPTQRHPMLFALRVKLQEALAEAAAT